MKWFLTRVFLPLLIVGLGALAGYGVIRSKPRADRATPPVERPMVEVERVVPRELRARLETTGVVQAARRVALTAEVSGRVVSHSPQLVPGGRIAKGAALLRIDPRDYELAVQQEEGRVRQAELELELERGRQEVAAREWALLRSDRPPDQAPLALRKPQLRAVEDALRAARGGLERSKLALERTTVRAPFNAVVIEEQVEVGRILSPGTALATLIGADEVWVLASIAVEDLAHLEIPGLGARTGSVASVVQRLGAGKAIRREGRVLRLQGELDAASRRAGLLVQVDDPFGAKGGGLPLLPGAHVEVEFEGGSREGVVPVSRNAVVGGSSVWTLDGESRLRRREVRVGWRSADQLFVTAGLSAGDRLVTSPLALPIEGSPARVQGEPVADSPGSPADRAVEAPRVDR